jgi:hypothetical protein
LSGLTKAVCYAHVLSVVVALHVRAQGGPPMLTDDPGTPGNGNFELNIGATIEGNQRQQSWELPTFDFNYGVGENIQLNLETSFNVLKGDGHGPIAGPGSASAAVKWRFLDQERGGLALSTFPRVEWNLLASSARRGLTEEGVRFFLPMEIGRSFGRFDLAMEVGPLIRTVDRSEWSYGVVIGTAVNSKLDLMAELHGSARTDFSDDTLTVNVGVRAELNETISLLGSLGHEVRAAPGEPLSLVSYLGVQLRF